MVKLSRKLLYSIIALNFILLGNLFTSTNVSSQVTIEFINPEDINESPNEWVGGNYFTGQSVRDNNIGSLLTPDYEVLGYYGWEDPEVVDPNSPLNDIKVALDTEDNVHVFWSGR
ncbi:MAG: hypothetical protein KAQ95_00770, partial [Candidatus Heimdallarchaeota archaeon]|nr:hypothetical protein [Candidatus Heimdallarchaeota archaeon]